MAVELLVQGMSCQHCVQTITAAVERVSGTAEVDVDLRSGLVTVGRTPDPRAVAAAIEDTGYDVHLLPAAAGLA